MATGCTGVFLRNVKTGRLFQDSDRWTDCRETARKFATSSEATRLAHDLGLKGVEVLIAFHDRQYDIQLPLL